MGGLQLVICNRGREVKRKTKVEDRPAPGLRPTGHVSYPVEGSTKKKNLSRPLEAIEIQQTLEDKVTQERIANQGADARGIEAQKRARVQRLKLMTMKARKDPLKTDSEVAGEFEQLERLRQVKLFREKTKDALMSKISLESEILNRKSIEAVPGQVHTVELEVNNPFDSHRTFEIAVKDPDLDKKIIDSPELVLVDDADHEWQFWHNKGLASQVADWTAVDA